MNLKRTFLATVAAAALVAVGMYPVVLTDWFSQTFSGQEDGTAFTGTGATGGRWLYVTQGVATNDTVGGRKCIKVNTAGTEWGAIQFDADDPAPSSAVRMDFSVSTAPLGRTPGLGERDWAGFRGAIGEIVAFTNVLTHAEREVTTGLLMSKWGIPGAPEFAPIHANTPVTMSAGATLDLSEQTLKVGSFTGAGTITNGELKTADGKITQSGGALSVPAVEGATYVASHAGEKLVIRDAQGVNVKIVLKQGWFTAGNTGRRAIFCDNRDVAWDIWRKDVTPKWEGDGWWSIAGGGFAVRLK